MCSNVLSASPIGCKDFLYGQWGTSVIHTSFNLLLRLWEEAAWWNVPACGSPIGRTNNVLAAALQPPTPTQPLGGMIGHGNRWRNISGCISNGQWPCQLPMPTTAWKAMSTFSWKGTDSILPNTFKTKDPVATDFLILAALPWVKLLSWEFQWVFFLNYVTLCLKFYKNHVFRCRFWIPDKAFQA